MKKYLRQNKKKTQKRESTHKKGTKKKQKVGGKGKKVFRFGGKKNNSFGRNKTCFEEKNIMTESFEFEEIRSCKRNINPESPIKLHKMMDSKPWKDRYFIGRKEKTQWKILGRRRKKVKLTIWCICGSMDETWLQPYNAEYKQSQNHPILSHHLPLSSLPLSFLSKTRWDRRKPKWQKPKSWICKFYFFFFWDFVIYLFIIIFCRINFVS